MREITGPPQHWTREFDVSLRELRWIEGDGEGMTESDYWHLVEANMYVRFRDPRG